MREILCAYILRIAEYHYSFFKLQNSMSRVVQVLDQSSARLRTKQSSFHWPGTDRILDQAGTASEDGKGKDHGYQRGPLRVDLD